MPAVLTPPMTTEELLAMPDDGMDRWLIRGELREKPMTVRNELHTTCTSRLSHFLWDWVFRQPKPWGQVNDGEAGVRLRGTPESTVGVDVVYMPPSYTTKPKNAKTTLIDGIPTLAVEVLSPIDSEDEINEKIKEYLASGVAHVWIVDPAFETIQVHQPGRKPRMFNTDDTITCEPDMPGFSLPVMRVFEC